MSRETQFIGLTKAAIAFVVDFEVLPSDRTIEGMFGEIITMRKWEFPPKFCTRRAPRPNACVREVIQVCPWSGGMMIFTQLEIDYGDGGSTQKCFEWVNDPTLSRYYNNEVPEFDQEKGTMWV